MVDQTNNPANQLLREIRDDQREAMQFSREALQHARESVELSRTVTAATMRFLRLATWLLTGVVSFTVIALIAFLTFVAYTVSS